MNSNEITLSKKDELINNVKRWILIDKQLKLITEKTRELRQLKNNSSSKICEYLNENPKANNIIEITGGELRVYQKKEYTALTFGYIEKCLGELIPNKEHVDYIIRYLKENRETIKTDDIRYKET